MVCGNWTDVYKRQTLLGFTPLPTTFFLILFGMVVAYLVLVELAKTRFYRSPRVRTTAPAISPEQRHQRHIRRRAARFVHVVPRADGRCV